jgi:hypothetical protein
MVATAALADASPDAELLALSAEIVRRTAEADVFQAEQVDVHEAAFESILSDPQASSEGARWNAAWAFSEKIGRSAAIEHIEAFDLETDRLFSRLMAIPATTQAGRAAKVRALIAHVMRDDWRGPANDLEWDKEMARALLGELAGMGAEELAAI